MKRLSLALCFCIFVIAGYAQWTNPPTPDPVPGPPQSAVTALRNEIRTKVPKPTNAWVAGYVLSTSDGGTTTFATATGGAELDPVWVEDRTVITQTLASLSADIGAETNSRIAADAAIAGTQTLHAARLTDVEGYTNAAATAFSWGNHATNGYLTSVSGLGTDATARAWAQAASNLAIVAKDTGDAALALAASAYSPSNPPPQGIGTNSPEWTGIVAQVGGKAGIGSSNVWFAGFSSTGSVMFSLWEGSGLGYIAFAPWATRSWRISHSDTLYLGNENAYGISISPSAGVAISSNTTIATPFYLGGQANPTNAVGLQMYGDIIAMQGSFDPPNGNRVFFGPHLGLGYATGGYNSTNYVRVFTPNFVLATNLNGGGFMISNVTVSSSVTLGGYLPTDFVFTNALSGLVTTQQWHTVNTGKLDAATAATTYAPMALTGAFGTLRTQFDGVSNTVSVHATQKLNVATAATTYGTTARVEEIWTILNTGRQATATAITWSNAHNARLAIMESGSATKVETAALGLYATNNRAATWSANAATQDVSVLGLIGATYYQLRVQNAVFVPTNSFFYDSGLALDSPQWKDSSGAVRTMYHSGNFSPASYLTVASAQANYFRWTSTTPTSSAAAGSAYQVNITANSATSVWVYVYFPASSRWYRAQFSEF